jgi:hypothetical protein
MKKFLGGQREKESFHFVFLLYFYQLWDFPRPLSGFKKKINSVSRWWGNRQS